jgi:NAD(P)-dependent dehydrogenase (short-subunit alcohol dehydrogenase family)
MYRNGASRLLCRGTRQHNHHMTLRTLSRLFLGLSAAIAVNSLLGRAPATYSFRRRTVMITGGSRGLGLLLARQLAREGAQLVLLARNSDELRTAEAELTIAGASVLALRCDIRKADHVEHAVQKAIERFGRIDVLINNAGIIQVGPLEHMTCEDFEEAMAVHFFGPLFATLAVLPHMQSNNAGRIVNITSIGGKIGLPHMAPYSASKFALVGFSDSVRAEVRRQGIFVTTVVPGLMRTGSPPNARFKGRYKQEYAWFAVSDSLPVLSMGGERAAALVLDGCRRGAARVTLGVHTKAAIILNELFPAIAARASHLLNCVLPDPDPSGSKQLYSGWESQSSIAPSWLTRNVARAGGRRERYCRGKRRELGCGS